MQLDFLDVLSNLVGLFMLIAVGYAAARFKIIPVEASPVFSKLLMKVSLPCTIFTSLLRPYDPAFVKDVLTVIALGFIIFPVSTLFCKVLTRLFRVPEGRRGTWSFCVTFINTGFMGFPIALALFGEEGLALTAIFSMPFNLLLYSMGAAVIAADGATENGKPQKLNLRAVLFTAINISAVLGLIFYFARITPPTAVMTPLKHLANITTPLSMFVTGLNLSNGKFSAIFRDRDILTSCLGRLVIMPLFCFAILHGINAVMPFSNALILGAVFINCSMPAPAVATIMAETYGADRSFAAGMVFMTSLLCILTIPVMAMLL